LVTPLQIRIYTVLNVWRTQTLIFSIIVHLTAGESILWHHEPVLYEFSRYYLLHWNDIRWHGVLINKPYQRVLQSNFGYLDAFYCSFFSPLLHMEGDRTIIWIVLLLSKWSHIVHNHHHIPFLISCCVSSVLHATAFIKQSSKHSDSMYYDFLIKAYFKTLIWWSSNTVWAHM
jgi:hypothetical protein